MNTFIYNYTNKYKKQITTKKLKINENQNKHKQ